MKSALLNLADIAGIKINLSSQNSENNIGYEHVANNQVSDGYINILRNSTDPQAFSHFLKSVNLNRTNNTTYTQYIEMAYTEVSQILVKDKQTLIENFRTLKTNENKLVELEQLKVKVSNSLARLKTFKARMNVLITHEAEITNILLGLEKKIKFNDNQKGLFI